MFNSEIQDYIIDIKDMVESALNRSSVLLHKSQFSDNADNLVFFDAICLNLLVIGEKLKSLDTKTDGKYLLDYPEIPWKEVIKMRDIIAHHYTGIKENVIYDTIKNDLPILNSTLNKMLKGLSMDLKLREDAVNVVVEKTMGSSKYFEKEQVEIIEKYILSEREVNKISIVESLFNEAEISLREKGAYNEWINETHEQLISIADGKADNIIKSLKI